MPAIYGTATVAGSGPEAHRLEALGRDNFARQSAAVTFARQAADRRRSADDMLFEAWAGCRNPGWDGAGAAAVPKERLAVAIQLVRSLPIQYPPPEATGEPDGDFSLEWYRGRRRVLAVSVAGGGLLHWSALIGDDDPRGTSRYDPRAGDAVPEILVQILSRIYR